MINKHSMQITGIRSMGQTLVDKLLSQKVLFATILGALMARVIIGEGLRPFAIPFFAAFAPLNPLLVGAGVLAGHLSVGLRGTFWLILPLVPIYFIRIRAPTLGAAGLVLLTLSGQIIYRLPTIVSDVMLGYDWMLLLLEFGLAATGVLIFYQARCALRRGPGGAEEGLEQSLCLVVTCALALTSIAGAYLGPFNVLIVASCWLVLTAASAGGSGAGACAGIVAGILAGYGHAYPAVAVATLALAGLLAGLFSIWGKFGSLGGFAAGIGVMMIYGGFPAALMGWSELALISVLFLLTPTSLKEKARRLLVNQNGEWAWEYQQRLRKTTVMKLQRLAMVFSRLSNSFTSTGGVEDMAGNHLEMARIFDQLACEVCTGCVNYRRCWERELYSTYSQLMDYLTEEEESAVFDGLLSRRCHNLEDLLTNANSLYRQFTNEQRWAVKMHECKDVVSEQLRGVSDVIGQLARQIRVDVNCRQDLEEELATRLSGWGVEVLDLNVEGTERNLPQVHIRAKVPAGENPLGVIQAMVSDVLGQQLQLVQSSPDGEASALVFAVPVKYKLDLGLAQSAKDGISGDCFSHLQTGAGKHVYMLSDGMGKGKRARAESNQALLLAQDMLEAGFSAETTIKALNSLLVLRQGNEQFATLDMAVLDCTLGRMDLYKTGAATSFIKTGNEVELISGAGLPIGIVPGIEPRLIARSLAAGEYLVLVSDGVIDGQDRDESWLVNQLKTMGNIAAPTMAKQLLNRATRVGSQLRDDATVVVIRVREAKNDSYWERRAV